jgi:hypothetical protein
VANRIVARYRDGRVVKGTTNDFLPTRASFHLMPAAGGPAQAVPIAELKALFFVRDLVGNKDYSEKKTFERPAVGRKVRVTFDDGEVLVGTTQGYQPGRDGFFMVPVDPLSNNERIYVLTAATTDVTLL